MISHRLRAIVAGIPIAVLSTVLIATPGFAVESLRISTPLAGATVSGPLIIEGSIVGDAGELDLGLAPQDLGDCGSPLIETNIALAGEQFRTSISTAAVPDGTYCLIAVADAGRLSTVVADITVDNSVTESLEGLQLPTESLDGGTTAAAESWPMGQLAVLGPLALGVTAALAVIVLVLGVWAKRRTAD